MALSPLAQLAEHKTLDLGVGRSSRSRAASCKMNVTLKQLSGKMLRKALQQKYLYSYEHRFVNDANKSIQELGKYVHWIFLDKTLCGMIAFGSDTDELERECWWIHRLMISPQWRRRCIALIAIRRAIEIAPSDTEILTSIIDDNHAACALFKLAGFKKTQRKWHNEIIWQYGV